MNFSFSKSIILLVLMLFIKHSIAQETHKIIDSNITTDNIAGNKGIKDSIIQSVVIIQKFDPQKWKLFKDSVMQITAHPDSLRSPFKFVPVLIEEKVKVKSLVSPDTLKKTVNLVPSLVTKDTIVKAKVLTDPLKNAVNVVPDLIPKDTIVKSKTPSDTLKSVVNVIPNLIPKDTIVKLKAPSDTLKSIVKVIPNQIKKDTIVKAKLPTDITKNTVKVIPQLTNKNDTVYLPQPLNRKVTPSNITCEAGRVFSTFKFFDSQGDPGEAYAHNISNSFSFGYQYTKTKDLFFRANIGLRNAGASLVKYGVNYNWNIQYGDIAIGVGYMYNKSLIKPYFSVSPYFGYMLKANQTIGSINYDIKQSTALKTNDFGLFFSPGIKFALSPYITFYAEYKYILGLQNLEKSDAEKSHNRGFSFNLGLSFNLSLYNQKLVK